MNIILELNEHFKRREKNQLSGMTGAEFRDHMEKNSPSTVIDDAISLFLKKGGQYAR